ncbi:MAG: YceI family protein [Luminiphilus sp.]|nr:YceI family protein [Luminiphilus sp.]
MIKRYVASLSLAVLASAAPTWAEWQVADTSGIQFVSVKNNTIGEVSHFDMISGTVGDQGAVEVRVALDSVETNIGIRNDRMKKMLFEVGLYPEAVITAQLSPENMAVLGSSSGAAVPVVLQIDLHGQVVSKDAVLTISATEVGFSATTSQPILLNAAEFDLENGVAALQSVAGLNAISRVIPVTVSLNFTKVAAASP